MSKTVQITIDNCIECPHHLVEPDKDSSSSNDIKVVCRLANKNVTSNCLPFNLRKESRIPEWCPLG